MKKILLGLLVLGAIAHAKEIVPAPIVQPEAPVVPVVVAPAWNFYLRGGADVWSTYNDISFDDFNHDFSLGKKTKGLGWEAGLEMTRGFWLEHLELGLGVAFQRHARFKSKDGDYLLDGIGYGYDSDLDRFDSVPIYLTAKYNFLPWDNGWTPYLKADAGYSINRNNGGSIKKSIDNAGAVTYLDFDTKIKDGAYMGAGFGIQYGDWLADLMYKVNTGKIEGRDEFSWDESIRYSRVTLSVGYKFDF